MDFRKYFEDAKGELEHAKQIREEYKKEQDFRKSINFICFVLATFGFYFLLNRLVPDATFFEILGWWGLVNYGLMVLKSYAN